MSETYELFQQAREHMAAGMNAQATVALEKAKRREPEKTSILEALGIAYFRIRRFAEAEREFREILELRSTTTRTSRLVAASRSRASPRRPSATTRWRRSSAPKARNIARRSSPSKRRNCGRSSSACPLRELSSTAA